MCLADETIQDTSLFVQFHGWFLSTNHVCLVMEYCPLGDISQCFSATMSETTARAMCEQLLEGLAKLHEMRITHRDLKPQVSSQSTSFRISAV